MAGSHQAKLLLAAEYLRFLNIGVNKARLEDIELIDLRDLQENPWIK